jgi:hypothetical protein
MEGFAMTFSQRQGLKHKGSLPQLNGMSDDLRTRLWNCLVKHYWSRALPGYSNRTVGIAPDIHELVELLWDRFWHRSLSAIPHWWYKAEEIINHWFFGCKWNEVYDLLEFVANNSYPACREPFIVDCNQVLEQQMSGYRFTSGVIAPISSPVETEQVEDALGGRHRISSAHLLAALKLLSDRHAPDYRNSMKESISAVEALCRTISRKPSASLSEALKEIERADTLKWHPALRNAFDNLYGYTGDADGIRHALKDDTVSLYPEDSAFMLVVCSAFINYLTAKAERASISLDDTP